MGAGSPFRLFQGIGLPVITVFLISIESIGLAQYTTTGPSTAPTSAPLQPFTPPVAQSTGTFRLGERYDTVRSPASQPGVDRAVLPNGLRIRTGPPTTQEAETIRKAFEEQRAAVQRARDRRDAVQGVAAQPARAPTVGAVTDVFTPTTRPATMPAGTDLDPFTLTPTQRTVVGISPAQAATPRVGTGTLTVAQAVGEITTQPGVRLQPATNPTVFIGTTPGRGTPAAQALQERQTLEAQVLQARLAAQAAQVQIAQAQPTTRAQPAPVKAGPATLRLEGVQVQMGPGLTVSPGRGAPPTTAQAQAAALQAQAEAARVAQIQALQAQQADAVRAAQIQALQAQAQGAIILQGGQLILQGNPGIAADPGADGFSVRKGDPAAADALAAFEQAVKDGAWEKAFTALTTVLESPSDAMVKRPDGFYLSSRTQIQQMLASLPLAGREAYRLFNDATARRALAQIDSPTEANPTGNQIAQLQVLYDRYFITSIGDQIADRLGDAKFEAGDFTGAASCWGAILTDYPDTSLSKARIATKRVIALSRAGQRNELQTAAAELREKYAGQTVRLGMRDVPIAELVDGLPKGSDPIAVTRTDPASTPPERSLLPKAGDDPLWQSAFMDDNLQDQIKRMSGALVNANAGYNPQTIVPDSAAAGNRVYLNWLGIGIAIDATTGKLLWRSEPYSLVPTRIQQMVVTGYDSGESSIVISPSGDRLLLVNGSPQTRAVSIPAAAIGRGVVVGRAGAAQAPAAQQLVRVTVRAGMGMIKCLSTDGVVLWDSERPALAQWSILGEPLIVEDTAYVTAVGVYGQSTELNLLAVSMADGEVRWKLTLGSMSQGYNQRGLPIISKPILRRSGDTMYILTGNGALLSVNLPARRIDWVYTYDTVVPMTRGPNGVVYSVMPDSPQSPSSLQLSGSMLYFKEKGSNSVYAVDAADTSLKWKRRVDADTTVAGIEPGMLLLLGGELTGIDLNNSEMRWSARTPLGTRMGQPLVSGSRAYVYGSKALYGVDLRSGAVEPFNTVERNGTGGTVLRLGDRLICVSTRSVTAYAIPADTRAAQ